MSAEDQDALDYVKRMWKRGESRMTARRSACDKRHRAYLGILEGAQDLVKDWRSALAPPYVLEVIETAYAMAFAEPPRSRVIAESINGVNGAAGHELLIAEQRRDDAFPVKFDQWAKQAFVMAVSPAKTDWLEDERTMRRRVLDGGELKIAEIKAVDLGLSRATFLPHAIGDFMWDPSSSGMYQMPWVVGRYWVSPESIKADAISDSNPRGIYRNVDMIGDTRPMRASPGQATSKDDKRDREGKIELWEMWTPQRVYAVANASVLLRNDPNPYFHGRIPWVVAQPVPDLYSMEGISSVDMIMDLQAAMWLLMNQRIDNVRLISNAIIKIKSSVPDPDNIRFKPGARWFLDDPNEDVTMWTPQLDITGPSLQAEAAIKQDLMRLAANIPLLGGDTTGIDAKTATQFNGSSNAAMQRIIAQRQRVYTPLEDQGEFCVELNRQCWNGKRTIRVGGLAQNEPDRYVDVSIEDILMDAHFRVESAAESLNRDQRRQEGLLLLNTMAGLAPALAGQQQRINLKPFVRAAGESYGMFDLENVIEDAAPPPLPPAAAPPGQPGAAQDPNAVPGDQPADGATFMIGGKPVAVPAG